MYKNKNRGVSLNSMDIYAMEDDFYVPARKGTRTKMRKIKENSWKNQSKACNQWAKHKAGATRGCPEGSEDAENMLRRLAKEGFPVVL